MQEADDVGVDGSGLEGEEGAEVQKRIGRLRGEGSY